MRHRARELLGGQAHAALNALRGHLAEIGVVAPQGAQHAYGLKRIGGRRFRRQRRGCRSRLRARRACVRWSVRLTRSTRRSRAIDKELEASVRPTRPRRRLTTIPGVGPVTASAIMATMQDASAFASGREFAAFLGLTPRQRSTGGKQRLGRITKMGDRYLRKLLVVGACATLSHRRATTTPCGCGRAG